MRKQKLEIAKKLLSKKISMEEICEITGIEKNELEELKKNTKNT